MATNSYLPTIAHTVIFPYMAQGHTIPLLDLSKSLSRRGLKVTIITTPLNSPFIKSHTSNYPTISLSVIPFPEVPYLPKGCENTSALPSPDLSLPFINATKLFKQPFEDILRGMSESNSPPICVISDFFLGWTLDSCRLFGIPRIVFHGMGALPMLIVKNINSYAKCTERVPTFSSDEVIELPVTSFSVPFVLKKTDFPESIWEADSENNEFLRVVSELDEADVNSWGVLVNSFEELEREYIPALDDLYLGESKAWCVGPLLLCNDNELVDKKKESSDSYANWLEERQEPGGVIYVSFGTQAHLGNEQIDEIAWGLEMAGEPFIWVIKSSTWVPPDEWEERVKGLGLAVRNWVDQRSILAHPKVGGFLTHCGWNSVLEGLCAGVPLLAWPMGGEQPLNAKYITMDLKAGLMIPRECNGEGKMKMKMVGRGAICDAVKKLMRGDQGRRARERAKEFARLAVEAVAKGGSSDRKLEELIERLTSAQEHSNGCQSVPDEFK